MDKEGKDAIALQNTFTEMCDILIDSLVDAQDTPNFVRLPLPCKSVQFESSTECRALCQMHPLVCHHPPLDHLHVEGQYIAPLLEKHVNGETLSLKPNCG